MTKLKRLLLTIMLGPLVPLIGVEGDGGKEEDPKDEDPKDEGSNDEGSNNDPKPEKKFSQADLDNYLTKRLAKERKNWNKQLEEEKKKANLDENEKLKLEKEEAEKKAQATIEQANKRLIRADIVYKAGKLNVIDTDAVMAMINMDDIDIDDNGDIKGVDDALKALIEKKPYLIKGKQNSDDDNNKAGDDQHSGSNKKPKVSFNDMLRRATGRM